MVYVRKHISLSLSVCPSPALPCTHSNILEKLVVSQTVRLIPVPCGACTFFTVFTRTRH
jgi:hypothetical protein